MSTESERQFNAAMVRGADQLKRDIGYNPTRFMQMVGKFGGVGAARALLAGSNASEGFTTLWEHRKLDMSVEAFCLLPWYQELFSDAELETARQRLTLHGFDVEAFLTKAQASPPEWTDQ